ncbi:hypothetical protein [Spirosoma harenae]
MKIVCLFFLLLTGIAYAQVPSSIIRRDSLPKVFPPDIMPNARPNNSFYRHPNDPKNVMRATLDNMPIKVPDSSTQYIILRSYQKYLKPDEPQIFLKPMPKIVPKRFR